MPQLGYLGAFIWDVDVVLLLRFPFFLFLEMINCHGSSFQVSSPANNIFCEMGCILQEGKQTSYLKAETAILGPFVTVGESFISAKEVIWKREKARASFPSLPRRTHPTSFQEFSMVQPTRSPNTRLVFIARNLSSIEALHSMSI